MNLPHTRLTASPVSLSSRKGGEGRGEEANARSNSIPLTPTLSPLGQGEGAATVASTRDLAGTRSRGFSLVEVLVVMTLLSLIVLALMQVFGTTQRAFRAGVTQTDVLEGGRSVMQLIADDLRQVSASGGYSNGAVNLAAEGNYSFNTAYLPLLQKLPGMGSGTQRTNLLNSLFFISRQNNSWVGTGYFVDHTSTSELFPLYRWSQTYSAQIDPGFLYANFRAAVLNNLATGTWTNMSHLLDGVAHLVVRTYDVNGRWLSYSLTNLPPGIAVSQAWDETQIYFYSNMLPATVEVELGTLEDRTMSRAESLQNDVPALPPGDRRTLYLQKQSGTVHLFRQQVNLPNVDRSVYP